MVNSVWAGSLSPQARIWGLVSSSSRECSEMPSGGEAWAATKVSVLSTHMFASGAEDFFFKMVFKSCNCDLEMCVLLEEECGPALIRLHPKRIHTNTQPTRRDIFRHCRTHRTALCPPPLSSHTHMHPQGKTAVHQDFFFHQISECWTCNF